MSTTESDSLRETSQKIEASLLPLLENYVNSTDEFKPTQGIDYLNVKNTLLLSYIIDLLVYIKNRGNGDSNSKDNIRRLTVVKTILDKIKGLDQKLKYQIDKVLSVEQNSGSLAAVAAEDPLQYRPNVDGALKDDDDDDDSSSDDEDNGKTKKYTNDTDSEEEDLDDDLAAAKLTLSLVKDKKKQFGKKQKSDNNDNATNAADTVYKAPRLTAVPYNNDNNNNNNSNKKLDTQHRRRLQTSEVAQTLRATYSDAPEQEDGAIFGKQRHEARKFAERQAERVQYEEDAFVRLTVTRKEKQERKRLMRQEASNLTAISDLGNIVRETNRMRNSNENTGMQRDEETPKKRTKKEFKAANSYQADLFGGENDGQKKSGKKRRKR